MFHSDKTNFEEGSKQLEKDFEDFTQKVSGCYELDSHSENFFNEYIDNMTRVQTLLSDFRNFTVKETSRLFSEQEAAKAKAVKDADFAKNSTKYLEAKKDELSKQRKQFDALKTNMRQSLSDINFRKLERMDNNPTFINIFAVLYDVLYLTNPSSPDKKPAAPFEWNRFKSEAISRDRLDDFKAKAAAMDFSELPEEKKKALEGLISDPTIKELIIKDIKAEPILEIYDFLECVPAYIASANEIKALQNNVAQIKRDTITREIKVETSKLKSEDIEDLLKHLDSLSIDEIDSKLNFHLAELHQTQDNFGKAKLKKLQEIKHQYNNEVAKVNYAIYQE